jgi:hypothetical protein
MQILHVAPETGLARRLKSLAGRYVPVDRDISRYSTLMPEAKQIDLCSFDAAALGRFDLILHMHVLSQLPCDPSSVLVKLAGMLSDGGAMYFSVPIRRDFFTIQDPSYSLGPEGRKARFGSEENWRMFGDGDVEEVLGAKLPGRLAPVDPSDYFGVEELFQMSIAPANTRLCGDSIFKYLAPVGGKLTTAL